MRVLYPYRGGSYSNPGADLSRKEYVENRGLIHSDWWDSLSPKQKREYMRQHPETKLVASRLLKHVQKAMVRRPDFDIEDKQMRILIAAAVGKLEDGDYVWWHYRSAIGNGRVKSVAKDAEKPGDIKYKIEQFDHHSGEPTDVEHYGRVLHKVSKARSDEMMKAKEKASTQVAKKADKWSGKVTEEEDFHTKGGIFKQSPEKIAKYLLSKGKSKAMSRLNFYTNRAGKNLDEEDRARLNKAKTLIEKATKG